MVRSLLLRITVNIFSIIASVNSFNKASFGNGGGDIVKCWAAEDFIYILYPIKQIFWHYFTANLWSQRLLRKSWYILHVHKHMTEPICMVITHLQYKTVWTYHVSSFSHHFPSFRFPESWYRDHPVKVWCIESFVAKISHYCEQSAFEIMKDVCNDIYQEELLAIHIRDLLVPVNFLRKRKYAR